MTYWVDWAADILRGAGLTVIEVGRAPGVTGPEWKRRARSSGGMQPRCEGIVLHHTASGPKSNGWPDVNYMTFNATVKPISNAYIDRQGRVWLMAAGGTNTEGLGGPYHSIPQNNANSRVWSIEIGNNGTGEVYPKAQLDAVLLTCAAMWPWLNNSQKWEPEGAFGFGTLWRMFSHDLWTTRKIDPAGDPTCRWARPGDRYARWDMGKFRGDMLHLMAALQKPAEPKPPSTTNPAPAPVPSPAPADVVTLPDGRYYVRSSSDWPWSVSVRVYGTGTWHTVLEKANPTPWAAAQRIVVPGRPGRETTVRDGEGPWSLLRRLGFDPAAKLGDFHTYNGGEGRVLRSGDKVFVPT
jgi:hypothetical protein